MLGDQNHVARICGVSDSLQRKLKKPLVQVLERIVRHFPEGNHILSVDRQRKEAG